LTKDLPNGAHSIVLKENAEKMQVFTKVGFNGAQVTLHPGRRYSSLDAMNGLETKISRTFLDFLHLGHEFFVISGHGA